MIGELFWLRPVMLPVPDCLFLDFPIEIPLISKSNATKWAFEICVRIAASLAENSVAVMSILDVGCISSI